MGLVQHRLVVFKQLEGSDSAQVLATPVHSLTALPSCRGIARTMPAWCCHLPTCTAPHPPLQQAATPGCVTTSRWARRVCPQPSAVWTALGAMGQPGHQLAGWHHPTLAGEAADVEVIALDAHHLSLAGVPAAVALDDGGAAPRGVGVLLIGNCWQKGGREKREKGRDC